MNKVWVADLQILGSAFFFGIGFIGQRAVSVEGLGPMTCNALRFALSAFLLVLSIPFLPPKFFSGGEMPGSNDDKEKGDDDHPEHDSSPDPIINTPSNSLIGNVCRYWSSFTPMHSPSSQKSVLHWGIYLGCINFLGSGLQQVGITMTSANKVAFIAGFDLFLTPIFSLFIPTFKRNAKPTPSVWLAVGVSIMGLYLLSNADMSELALIGGHGELVCLVSTVFWTLHITYTDIATTYVDCLHMMCVQLSVVSILSAFFAVLLEPQAWFWHHMLMFAPWMLFLAVVEGLGFTLMAMGQHFSPPTHAAILLSLEGVFASVASYFVLGETLSYREFSGCCLMLLATMIAKLGCCHLDFAVAEAEKNMMLPGGSYPSNNNNNNNNSSNFNQLIQALENGPDSGSSTAGIGNVAGSGVVLSSSGTSSHPVSCAMRVKACVTVPAIMLRETIANFRVNVAYLSSAAGWLAWQMRALASWLSSGASMQKMAMNTGAVAMNSGSALNSSVLNSSSHGNMMGHSTSSGRHGHISGREQHVPLISKDSLSNIKI